MDIKGDRNKYDYWISKHLTFLQFLYLTSSFVSLGVSHPFFPLHYKPLHLKP